MAQCSADAAGLSPVVIAGLAGAGKSALTLRVAHELTLCYPDGQLYSSMRGQDGPLAPEVVLPRFLRALGAAAEEIPAELPEQAALYRSLLAGRKVLVVLDDVTAEDQVRPLLPGGPPCLVLVTSRNPLPALASGTTYQLGLLDPAESLELLTRIAGMDRVVPGRVAAERIVELCGGCHWHCGSPPPGYTPAPTGPRNTSPRGYRTPIAGCANCAWVTWMYGPVSNRRHTVRAGRGSICLGRPAPQPGWSPEPAGLGEARDERP